MSNTDLTGKTFGRLTVLCRTESSKYGDWWKCLCVCGNTAIVAGRSLKSNHTRSCGCLQKETAARLGSRGSWFHNNHLPYVKEIRSIYFAIKGRCFNKNNMEYQFYGGKGITLCEDWLRNPKHFYEWAMDNGFKKGLTIERIDNNKGYMPSNCRFATRAEQNRNTSRNNKVIDTDTGTVYVTAEVARMIGVSRSTTAKWYREEGLRTLSQFIERFNNIVNFNAGRTRKAKGVVEV